jgi:glycolate oxidase FAD binding subunit
MAVCCVCAVAAAKIFGARHCTDEVLDTRSHAGIVSYEPSELVVTVRAGTPLAELEAALAEKGQCLAFEPPHFDQARGTWPPWAAWWPPA